MSDGIGQAIAVAKLLLAPICQQPYWGRNVRTNRTDLPEAGRSFSSCFCMLTCQFINEANTAVAVSESQPFNELGHLSTQQMRRSCICASTGSQPCQSLTP